MVDVTPLCPYCGSTALVWRDDLPGESPEERHGWECHGMTDRTADGRPKRRRRCKRVVSVAHLLAMLTIRADGPGQSPSDLLNQLREAGRTNALAARAATYIAELHTLMED